jgi:hypothetical protein
MRKSCSMWGRDSRYRAPQNMLCQEKRQEFGVQAAGVLPEESEHQVTET